MEAFIHYCNIQKDGTRDSFLTIACEVKEKPLEWQKQGLAFTASGYGARIPTTYVIKPRGQSRWLRVYCKIYSNIGTLFVGKKCDGSAIVQINDCF